MDLYKTALVTHKGCMDGSTCAIVFCNAGGKRENVFFVSPNHRDVDEMVEDLMETWAGPILIADASISLNLAKKVYRNDVFLLDHHKSAIPLKDFPWCEIDVENTRSGGMMLFDWLKMHANSTYFLEYKDLVTFADDHDRWIKNYKESDIVSLFHEVLGQDLFIERFMKNPSPTLNQMEEYVVNLECKKRDNYIKQKMRDVQVISKKVQGHNIKIGFVSAGTHQSLLGNTICSNPALDVDVAILVGTSISLRARQNCPVDLSVLSKKLGGGGHKAAAGFSIDKILNNNSLLDTVKNYLLNHEEVWT